jgi:DNA-binding NarL/FixJ family response regulator
MRKSAGPIMPIEIVLAGNATQGVKLPTRKPKVVSAPGVEPTFDAASNRADDVRVIVVDVDEFGVSFIRDLHTIFPSVRIVALSASPRKLAASLRAGAVIALPRATPPALLTKLIQQLLAPPHAGQAAKKPKRHP